MFKVCHALATVVACYYMSFCVKQVTLQRRYMDSLSNDIIAQQMMQSNSNGINPSWLMHSLKANGAILQ